MAHIRSVLKERRIHPGALTRFAVAECRGWRWGSVPRRGLRGIGPALAGNVGAGWAFALAREGDQDVDVPMLAPARSRCRFGAVNGVQCDSTLMLCWASLDRRGRMK